MLQGRKRVCNYAALCLSVLEPWVTWVIHISAVARKKRHALLVVQPLASSTACHVVLWLCCFFWRLLTKSSMGLLKSLQEKTLCDYVHVILHGGARLCMLWTPSLPRARKVPSCLSLNSIPVLFCQVFKLLSLAGLPGDWMKIGTNGDLHSPVWYNMETGGRFHVPATFVMIQWLPPILVDHQCCHALQLLSTNGWSYSQWGTHESTIDSWGRTQVFYARSRFCARSYNMFNWIAFWTVGFTSCCCRNSIVTIVLN